MTSDKVVRILERVLSKNGVGSLSAVETTIIQGAWCNQSYQEIALGMGYDIGYVKQIGSQLWQKLSGCLGEKVTKHNFQRILKQRLIASEKNTDDSERLLPRQDWGEATDADFFYGRIKELTCLQNWILGDRCRLVEIFGMGGMGKTTLSVKLAQKIQDQFDIVIWRSLRNAPTVNELLTDLLKIFSYHSTQTDFDHLLRSLLSFLREQRSLIVLDNVESILQSRDRAGTYRQGYELYSQLFYCFGHTVHESAIVLTGREKIREISSQEGSHQHIRSIHLQGLSPQVARSLLEVNGNFIGTKKQWQYLIEYYTGNPLALKMVAPVIQNFFGGQLKEFIEYLNQGHSVFGDIRDLIASQIERLSHIEQQIMVWLGIYREPVCLSQLRSKLLGIHNLGNLLEALTSLERKSLIERNLNSTFLDQSPRFTLQPVVMEYMTNWFVQEVIEAIHSSSSFDHSSLLHTHTLILAQAKDYIRKIQTRLILEPIARQLLQFYGGKQIKTKLNKYLTTLRNQDNKTYASGNILNLLQQLQIPLQGWDFSNLTIWQAYLQDATLHQTNFSNADLSQSVFKDTFSQVLSVAFSPDGQLLAASDVSYEIHVWRLSDGQPFLKLRAQDGWCWSVAISPNNQILASSANGTVDLWDLKTGESYGQLQDSSSRVFSLAFSPDGKFLASGGEDNQIRVWSISKRKLISCLSGHTDEVKSVTFSPQEHQVKSHQLASASLDGTIRIWSLVNEDSKVIATESPIWSIAYSPDGKFIASSHRDSSVEIWDVKTNKQSRSLVGHQKQIRSIDFHPNGRLIASGSDDKSIRLWNWQSGQLEGILNGHDSWISNIVFSPDGHTLASSSEDQSVWVWDLEQKQPLKVLRGHNRGVWSVAIHPNGNYLVSGGQDRKVRFWSLHDKQTKQELTGNQGWIFTVAVSPNGKWIASGGEDCSVRLWDSETGELIASWLDHTHEVWAVTFCPHHELLVSGSLDGTIRLWSPTKKTCQGILQGHHSGIWALAVSPNGKWIASGSQDQSVRIWDVKDQICIESLPCEGSWVRGLAFSSDGRFLSSGGSNGYVMVWDLKTGHRTVIGTHSSLVLSVAFSADGEWLASCSGDTTIKLWSLKSWQCYQTLSGHDKWVRYISFSADDQRLISCSQDETIQILRRGLLDDPFLYSLEETLRLPRPYEKMNITGVTGLTEAQKVALKTLGAIDF